MKAFVCGICSFASINGSAPEKCPVCGAPKSAFQEKDIQMPVNPSSLTEGEKKHVPVIKINKECDLVPEGCQDVIVRIGEILHPMTDEHKIVRIDIYLNKEYIERVSLTDKINPAAVLHLKPGSAGKISVVELCNIHGFWINESDL